MYEASGQSSRSASGRRGLGPLAVVLSAVVLVVSVVALARLVDGAALADALGRAVDAMRAFHFIGLPEGKLALAQLAVYLAVAPKSNAIYSAYSEVERDVRNTRNEPVPLHIRNAPTRLMKDLGYGDGYRYAHDESEGYAAGESYWPDELSPENYYQPLEQGLEVRIAERLARLRALDAESPEIRRQQPAKKRP